MKYSVPELLNLNASGPILVLSFGWAGDKKVGVKEVQHLTQVGLEPGSLCLNVSCVF